MLLTPLLRNGHLLILSIALIMIAGLAAWNNLSRIEDPHITTRNATVITSLLGANADRVEALVTKKLEEALREVAEIKTLESTSRADVSLIAVEPEDKVDSSGNARIFSRIRDKLADAERELPPDAGKPELDDQRGAVAYSLIAAVVWEGDGEPQLAILDRLSDDLADRLRNLPGTEQAVRFGAADEEIRVTVKPDELAALGLRAAERSVVSLGDVATVTKTWREPPDEIAYADGCRAVLIGVRTRDAVQLDAWAAQAR